MSKIVYKHSKLGHEYDPTPYGRHRFTAAIDLDTKFIGIAICSKKDQFNRKKGNALAKERLVMLDDNDIMIVLPATLRKTVDTYDLSRFIADCIHRVKPDLRKKKNDK